MIYFILQKQFPNEIVDYILKFDGTYKENMNKVIQELTQYNNKIEEYWSMQEYEWLMDDHERLHAQKRNINFNIEYPYLLKSIH